MKKLVLVFAMLMMSMMVFSQTLQDERIKMIKFNQELSQKYRDAYTQNLNDINEYIYNDENGEYESSLAELFKLQKELNKLMIKTDYDLYLLLNNFDKYLANLNKK